MSKKNYYFSYLYGPSPSLQSHFINKGTTPPQLFHDGGRYHIETSPLISSANQWTGFHMITASIMKELNVAKTTSIYNHFKTLSRQLNYTVVLSTKRRRCSDVLITTSFYQQYSNIFLTSSLQRRFINNITTSLGHLLTSLVFTTLL